MAGASPQNPPVFPAFRTILLSSVMCLLLGWGGLAILLMTSLPDLRARWLFFFLVVVGVTGAVIPISYLINRRFMTTPPATGTAIVRQATWFGIYAALIAWLQQGRVLTPVLALVLALGFALAEFLFRVREISLWRPKGSPNE